MSENQSFSRRSFIQCSSLAAAGAPVVGASMLSTFSGQADPNPGENMPSIETEPVTKNQSTNKRQIKFAVKYGMIKDPNAGSVHDKFALLKDLGFDGVELDSPNGPPIEDVIAASQSTGLPVHGVVDSIHWKLCLSDPDPEVRAKGVEGLQTAIRDSKTYGGSSVLLVPGRVLSGEIAVDQDQVWQRSIEGIRKCLPLAAELGIHILIENVWNGFCYIHNGPADQSADKLAEYIDAINSPWVGSYFDIGNHQKYGKPEEWIRTLGKRIVKVDVKDWGVAMEWAKIGEGDINWTKVCASLDEIGFTGWATAEVTGGDRNVLTDIKQRMDKVLSM